MAESPNDWRVWFDEVSGQWHAQRWDGIGGIAKADRIELHAKGVTDGKFLRFPNAEAKVGTLLWVANESVVVDVLRMMPPTQRVQVKPEVVLGVLGPVRGRKR